MALNLRALPLNPSAGGLAGRGGKAAGTGGDPLGPDAAGRHELSHILAIAFWALGHRVVGGHRQFFKTVTARLTLVFIDRHRGFL